MARCAMLMLVFPWFLAFAESAVEPPPPLECSVKDDPDERVFRLEEVKVEKGKVWAVSMKSKDTNDEWIRLELRNKKPKLEKASLALDYQSPLGARVKWKVKDKEASLEIEINYELEVNDNDYKIPLDSRVHHMNTEKAVTNLDCKFGQK